MKSTKAQIQIQFNWVFVLIVGSIFLIFFFALINNQSKTSDDRISISQSKLLETIISATGQKDDTLKEYELPRDLTIEFACKERGNEYFYSVNGFPTRDTKYDLLFTRDSLQGRYLQTWTQQWEVPFRAGTLLFITNSQQGFIFYNISPLRGGPTTSRLEALYGSFPSDLSSEVISGDTYEFEDVKDRNYESNTFVFIAGEEPLLGDIEEVKNPRIVLIRPGGGLQEFFEYGTIYFFTEEQYDKFYTGLQEFYDDHEQGETGYKQALDEFYKQQRYVSQSSSYLGKASLYGALFSQDKDSYDCNMQKAYKRLQSITQMYYIRVDAFTSPDSDLRDKCKRALGFTDEQIVDENGDINLGSSLYPHNRLYILYNYLLADGTPENIELVHKYLFELEENNKAIATISRCPIIY